MKCFRYDMTRYAFNDKPKSMNDGILGSVILAMACSRDDEINYLKEMI